MTDTLHRSHVSRHLKASTGTRVCKVIFYPSYLGLTLITDIFLPSYLDYDSSDLEHRPDPVQEIILTDEEAAAILPK
jgi:hypothetical protein